MKRGCRPSYSELYSTVYAINVGCVECTERKRQITTAFLAQRLDPRNSDSPAFFVARFVQVRTLLATQSLGRPLINDLRHDLRFAATYASLVERTATTKIQRVVMEWLYRPWKGPGHLPVPFHVKAYEAVMRGTPLSAI